MNWIEVGLAVGGWAEAVDENLLRTSSISGILCLEQNRPAYPDIPGLAIEQFGFADGGELSQKTLISCLVTIGELYTKLPFGFGEAARDSLGNGIANLLPNSRCSGLLKTFMEGTDGAFVATFSSLRLWQAINHIFRCPPASIGTLGVSDRRNGLLAT